MRPIDADVIVVGSGPAGAQAARKLTDLGVTVWSVDVGELDLSVADAIPEARFTELRHNDAGQARYFIGDLANEGADDVSAIKAGAQLTPPRAYVTHDVDRWAPLRSSTFRPMLSLAKGGLGAAWGAGAFTFNDAECLRAGLVPQQLRPYYDEVAADIGISAPRHDDISDNMVQLEELQEPQPLDDNAQSLLVRYQRERSRLEPIGFRMGRASIAMLSRPLERDGDVRGANPLFDMDFYSDASRSVYRPRFTIDALRRTAGYRYVDRMLALRFIECEEGVELHCLDLRTGTPARFICKRLMLAAGALNTTRIVARSFEAYDRRLPLLSNPYRYVPSINLSTLGKPVRDARHSMVQLIGTIASGSNDPEQVFVSVYSYRSLLLHKLVKEMPLPPALGLLAARVMQSSLTILGVHFPEAPTERKWLALERGSSVERDTLVCEYASNPSEQAAISTGLHRLAQAMQSLGLLRLGTVDPGNGASIHYAGPLPFRELPDDLATAPDGRLHASHRVYVGDSASWTFLPAKGPTLTIMAHARNVAAAAARSLDAASR